MSWGGGYITDVGYIAGLHPGQTQPLMALAALMSGHAARPVTRDEPFHLCDIGCGFGITALVIAAANPAWHVTGLDFLPAHIAHATALAGEAGIANVTFLEADLRTFPDSPACHDLAPFDAVTTHGVWTWVHETVQDGIVRLLAAKLKSGGMCHITYNSLTGWQGALGLQRLVREAGLRLAHRSDRQAAAGAETAQALAAAGGGISYTEGFGETMLERLKDLPATYIAHEMMNQHWRPVMHGDVAASLARAKLDFAGSTRLLNNFPQLMLTPEQRSIADKFDDPEMLELFKDICKPQALRSDVFIRGPRRIDPIARDAALNGIVLGLTAPEQAWKFEFEAASGMAQMSEPYYRKIFTRLKDGPAAVGELLSLPDLPGRRDNPAELIGVAIGTEQAVLVPNPGAALDERCARLNQALLRAQFAAGQGSSPIHFALPALGQGITLTNFAGMLVHEIAANPQAASPNEMAARLAIHQTAEQRAALAANIAQFYAIEAPPLRNLGFPI